MVFAALRNLRRASCRYYTRPSRWRSDVQFRAGGQDVRSLPPPAGDPSDRAGARACACSSSPGIMVQTTRACRTGARRGRDRTALAPGRLRAGEDRAPPGPWRGETRGRPRAREGVAGCGPSVPAPGTSRRDDRRSAERPSGSAGARPAVRRPAPTWKRHARTRGPAVRVCAMPPGAARSSQTRNAAPLTGAAFQAFREGCSLVEPGGIEPPTS